MSVDGGRPLKTIDIVVPVFNEEEGIEEFYQQLRQVVAAFAQEVNIYFINDGSTDNTSSILEKISREDDRVIVLELSRNFGHQAALTAGLDRTDGDIVITMDGDGQHPPEMLPEMIKLFQTGYDIVLTQRLDESGSLTLKKWTSRVFYWILNRISGTDILPGVADFRLASRQVIDGIKQMREYHRFLRGMIAWMGYRTVILPYAQPERIAGRPKYSLRKMIKLALDASFSFSLVPLYMCFFVGLLFLLLALVEVVYVSSFWIRGLQHTLEPGWSSLMFVLLFVGGTLLTILGIVGVYVGYIFQEVKRRPIYMVRAVQGGRRKGEDAEREE